MKNLDVSSASSERTLNQVYIGFGIDPLEVAASPQVSGIIAQALGGTADKMPMARIFHLLASSDSKAAREFLSQCDTISRRKDYDRLSIEALCVYAGVSPFKILDAIARTEKRLRMNEKSLMKSVEDADYAQMEVADEAFDQAFPAVSEKLEVWGEWRRIMMDERLKFV